MEQQPESPADASPPAPSRKRRNRAQTEADLIAATMRLLRRDGVLAGVRLQEVAEEAGVNRGQIYQIYGSRRALLRAALADSTRVFRADRPDHLKNDFVQRQQDMIRWLLHQQLIVQLGALLALDGEERLFRALPEFEATREALARDQAEGSLPPGIDVDATHILTVAAGLGYVVFREALARSVGVPPSDLDERVVAVFDDVVEHLATTEKD